MAAGNFFAAEGLIIERLQEKLGNSVRKVAGAPDLDGVRAAAQVTPAVYVIYGGYKPERDNGPGVVEITQRWLVVVTVRNVRDSASGEGVRDDAGALAHATLTALMGWRPADHTPLILEAGPSPGIDKGFGYFPFVFTTKRTIRGDP